ncbi:MAG: FtsW/RodA/SpoVE family cell cycle protein [Bacilli bacterium]|nr:FtsW/RodA/SpoVE family cell cycle protein [Bacilli bacterium]
MLKIIRKIDKPLFFITIIMFIFGLLMIFSASYVKAITSLGNAYYYLIRHGIILIICMFVFLFFINIPSSKYKKHYKTIVYLSIALLLALIPFGITVNGAKSWLHTPFLNFQPSELAKIAIIVYMAVYYEKHKDNKDDYRLALKPFVLVIAICIIIAMQPDLGSALIIFIISALLFIGVPLLPTVKKKIWSKIILTAIFGVAILAVLFVTGKTGLYEYQLQRFNFLKPCKRYTEVGTGYQVCNSYIAINNGGLFGVGIGNSTQKYLYLPESYTDFIFPVIIEELGLIVGIVIIFMYAIILYRIIMIAKSCYNLSQGLICYGVAIYILVHIFINLVGVLGLMPLTGVPLPFLSYGGSYSLCLTIALTMVQRIKAETEITKQEEKLKNKIREI